MKNIGKYFIFVSWMIFNAGFVYSSEEILTWQECVRQTMAQNPDLISAAEKIKQTKADKDIEISTVLPQANIDADGKRAKTANKNPAGAYSYGVTVRQLLFDGFKTASDITGALKTIQAQKYNYNVVSSNIRLDLRSAFVGLMKAQELIGITENIAERRKQNLELIKLRYEAGREHKGALLTAEADMAQAEFEVSQAKRGRLLSQTELCETLGRTGIKPLIVEGDFLLEDRYASNPDFVLLAENTPFLRELIIKKEVARYNLNSKEADFLPKVYLDGSMGKRDTNWPPQKEEWSIGMSASLLLFEGGRSVMEITKAKSQCEQAQADERSGQSSVLVTLAGAWKDLRDAIENVSVQKKFLDASIERAKITKSQYETGLASFNDWIIIEDNLVKAKKLYLTAQRDMLINEAYWIQAIGGTLEYDRE